MNVIPPPLPLWKTRVLIVLPGLLCGMLLALIQIVVILLGTAMGLALGLPRLPPTIFFIGWLFYFVIPALLALLVTSWTRQPFSGYRAGQLAGVLCMVSPQWHSLFPCLTLPLVVTWA